MVKPQAWMDQAACKGKSELFFPTRGQHGDAAKAICRTCSVQQQCREYAHESGSEYGVWAGEMLTPRTRVPVTLHLPDKMKVERVEPVTTCPSSPDCLLYAMEVAGYHPARTVPSAPHSADCLQYAIEVAGLKMEKPREAEYSERNERGVVRGVPRTLGRGAFAPQRVAWG